MLPDKKFVNATTHEMRYTVAGSSRTSLTTLHIVNRATETSLCGRDARDWFKAEWLPDRTECRHCKKRMIINQL